MAGFGEIVPSRVGGATHSSLTDGSADPSCAVRDSAPEIPPPVWHTLMTLLHGCEELSTFMPPPLPLGFSATMVSYST